MLWLLDSSLEKAISANSKFFKCFIYGFSNKYCKNT